MHYKKRKTIAVIIILLLTTAAGAYIILSNLADHIVFFYPPSAVDKIDNKLYKHKVRVGGMIKPGSVFETQPGTVRFIIHDHLAELAVDYTGPIPLLFREGQGIIAEGNLNQQSKIFHATQVLIKHDENYRPPSTE